MKTVFKVLVGVISTLSLWALVLLFDYTIPRPVEFLQMFSAMILWFVSFAGVLYGNCRLWGIT